MRVLSELAETAAFLDLGLTCVLPQAHLYHGYFILYAIMLCCVSRPVQIYFFSNILNRLPITHKLDHRTQHMLSFAGLRGVVAFACANLWPAATHTAEHHHNPKVWPLSLPLSVLIRSSSSSPWATRQSQTLIDARSVSGWSSGLSLFTHRSS